MVKIKWSKSAKNDLRNIVNFISQDSPGYSKYFIKALFEKIDYLIDFPKMGQLKMLTLQMDREVSFYLSLTSKILKSLSRINISL